MSNFPNNSLQLEKKPRRNFKLKCSSFDLSEQSLPIQIEDLSTWQKIRTLALSLIERKSCDMKNLFHRNIDLIKQNSIDRQNWNFFVGDQNYQTNSLLCFKGENVEKTYQQSMMSGNEYTLRAFLLLLSLSDKVLQDKIHRELLST